MTFDRRLVVYAFALVLLATGCKLGDSISRSVNNNSNSNTANNSSTSPSPAPTNASSVATGVEKQKPAPGTGNVQGKVLFNGKPVPNNEVKLCEKFNRFLNNCDGKTYSARTDNDGDYVLANVPPMTYEGLKVRVFDTDYWVFATTGIGGLSAANYDVSADKTLFVTTTNLFKSDLKTLNPKAGSKVSGQGLELKWQAYPDAAYYKFSLSPEEIGTTSPYVNERVEGTSFAVDKSIPKGTYRWKVEAYNDDGQKLSENDDDIKFTITDGS